MAISSPATYLPTTDSFIAHWTSANAELAGDALPPILLGQEAVSVADLTTLRNTLETQRAAVEAARNDLEGARATIEVTKVALLERMAQFNGKVRSLGGPATILGMLPKAFSVSEGMGRVIPPLDDLADVWGRFNAEAAAALLLMGGYALFDFHTDLAALKEAYTAYQVAENGLKEARGRRNETQDAIYPILKAYRQRIPAEFPEGSAISVSLPRLTPLPGSTPDPVEASGVYDAAEGRAELSWTESTDADLVEYEVRGVAGPDYDADDESVVANVPAGAPREWAGTYGLGVPGAAASFRVYVMTSTGNERASNTVTLVRPV